MLSLKLPVSGAIKRNSKKISAPLFANIPFSILFVNDFNISCLCSKMDFFRIISGGCQIGVSMGHDGFRGNVNVFENVTMKILTFVFQKSSPTVLTHFQIAITHKHNYGSLIHFSFILFQKNSLNTFLLITLISFYVWFFFLFQYFQKYYRCVYCLNTRYKLNGSRRFNSWSGELYYRKSVFLFF